MKSSDNKGFKIAFIVIVLVAIIGTGALYIKDEAFKNPKLADFIYCPQEENVKNCIKGLEEVSFCKYKETKDVKCTTKKLKEEQFIVTQQKK